MDTEIHSNKNNSRDRVGHIAMPAVEEHSHMVVPVQEHEFFFVDYNEEGVKELTVGRDPFDLI